VLLAAIGGLSLAAGWALTRSVRVNIGSPPADVKAIPVTFPSSSGSTIHGWWCPAPGAHRTVVLLPGVRANRLSMVSRERFLHAAGYSVLLLDFRATGESPGNAITFGYREA
jgi:cephalosporin-C deacetylase-like acetyl esterase